MNGIVYRIWNTNTNRWVRSNSGLSMWQKLSGARNTLNQNSYLKGHCIIKEFIIIPKDEVVDWSSNEYLLTEELQENYWNLFGERFDKELKRIIPDYSRDNAKMVYCIYYGTELDIRYYIFSYNENYYRITTQVNWRSEGRTVVPQSSVLVEQKYELAYKFVVKDEYDSIATSILGL